MVYDRIKIIKLVLMFILLAALIIGALLIKPNIETNLIRSILPQSVCNNTDIVKLANKSLSLIKVVFETDDIESLNKIKQSFTENINKQEFEIITNNSESILNLYLSAPENFLSYNDRQLLKNKEYEKLYHNSLIKLYNPVEVQFAAFDKDPYFLLNSFLVSLIPNSKTEDLNNKSYDFIILKIKDNNGLSPSQSNIKVKQLVKLQKTLSTDNTKIYLAGTPIHSYYASVNSMIEINIICVLSTLLIIALVYFYFRNFKLLLPIALSMIFGVLSGFIAVSLLFDTFQTITMVFSATLIGIGIDYSFHYLFNKERNAKFIKNLSLGLFTTTSAFVFLYLSGIELLQQIAVFMIIGLITIYLFIITFYPCFNFPVPKNNIHINIPKPIKPWIIIILLICIVFGFFKLSFNDSLTAFYTPGKDLKQAEMLFNKVSGQDNRQMKMITVSGNSIEDILQKEENITDELNKQNIEYTALSKYIPSLKRQRENTNLVKELYKINLKRFNNILSDEQIKNLQKTEYSPVSMDIDNFKQLKNFMLKNNTSIIFVNAKEPLFTENNVKVIDLNKDVSSYLKSYRITLLKLLPIAVLVVWIILFAAYGKRYSYKIIVSPSFAILSAIGVSGLFGQEINLFSVIALFLILGFTIDYSIFTFADGRKSEDAILCSFTTTAFVFFLLSFTKFKLISSISLVLFIGILISYICRKVLFSDETEQI
ncbi:MAG: hypothetical protein LUG16_02555 [Candidatus Gastranaerophilales bacterium]|nr:hypothetical protein [Candidatus Gastranaerophilales bacterium]